MQRKLGCPRTSLGSLSEATDVFDPQRLEGILGHLLAQVPTCGNVGRGMVPHVLTAVDGSVVKTLASLAEAAYLNDKKGESHSAWRFHTHFDIDRHVPTRMEVTAGINSGKSEEKHQLRQRIEPDHCYVLDRWYAQFSLFNDILAAGSSYVCRIRDNSNFSDVVEERPLSDAARTAQVSRDIVVAFGATCKARLRRIIRSAWSW